MRSVVISVQRVRRGGELAPLPAYQTSGAAGMDLVADNPEPIRLPPRGRARVPTGLRVEIPEGFEAQIRPRSGLAARHGVTLLNAPGTIDSDYRGEIELLLVNLGDEEYTVRRGDRIGQMVVAPVVHAAWHEVERLSPTSRGAGGFGHTDRAAGRR